MRLWSATTDSGSRLVATLVAIITSTCYQVEAGAAVASSHWYYCMIPFRTSLPSSAGELHLNVKRNEGCFFQIQVKASVSGTRN